MLKLNIRKYLDQIENRLPSPWRARLGNVDNFLKYVVRERWYKLKFLGALNYVKFMIFKRPLLTHEKRILAVADVSAFGLALGAYIEFAVRLLCEAHIYNVDKIDFAFVYNPEKPVSHWKISWINKDNFHIHFTELLPLINVNPRLGSIFIFNSHDEFENYYLANSGRYVLRPSFFNYLNKKSIGRGNYVFLCDFYNKYNFLPKLIISNFETQRVRALIKRHVNDKYLISVNLRLNNLYDSYRNALIETWEKFFDYCLTKHPDMVFVILGRKSETTELLRNKQNIIFAQDYNVNMQQTLAFIENSFLYMATSCGPASYAIMRSDIPYIITSYVTPDMGFNYHWLKEGDHLPWQNKQLQKFFWQKETYELLTKEFEDSISKLDRVGWIKKINLDNTNESILEWPYLIKE